VKTIRQFFYATPPWARPLVAVLLLCADIGQAAEEPHGLLLRKGMIVWQMPLAQARPLVEENIRPNTMQLLANQKKEGFGCQPQGKEVTRCVWACCVDLGEPDIVHFSTLWFYNDRFYAYSVNFNTNQFPRVTAALAARLGPPSREEQENRSNLNVLQGGLHTYIVNTKRWDVGNVVILLADRGGGQFTGQLYATYLPLARQATPPRHEDETPAPKLPF
jgi:hypothetical protein